MEIDPETDFAEGAVVAAARAMARCAAVGGLKEPG